MYLSCMVSLTTQTNALPATVWLIAYIACSTDSLQEVLEHIEGCVIKDESTRESTSFDTQKLLANPILNSALSETLRLQFSGFSVRGVSNDTTLTVNSRPFELKKGSTVFISATCVHKDPEIYEKPHEFRLKRFVEMHTKIEGDNYTDKPQTTFTKHGMPIRHPLIPWGGGHFMVFSSIFKMF